MLKNILSDVYQDRIPLKILNLKIQETKVDCNQCYRASSKYKGPWPYKNNLKCCTFHPFLPNYLIGGILSDPQLKKAHAIIENKIKEGTHALPVGIFAPLEYQKKFHLGDETDFGQDETLLCPYYDKKNHLCSVWEYRGAVCTTFYCQSTYGRSGKVFWRKLRDYISYVEMALMEESLIQRGFSPRDISAQLEFLNYNFTESKLHLKSKADLKKYISEFWRTYEDPIEFYKKCYQIVKNTNS
ncbi:MAG TPA: hypothetical protein PLJ21_13485, partial [Pseudobdellovibrionaceae bacterium]|nr:hypothetical protein [Pseudobdellovibrionaceae bacterium]